MNFLQKKTLIEKAKRHAKRLRKLRMDQRFKNVMGRLIREGWLEAKGVIPNKFKLYLEDVFWVGEKIEPRVLEILPAIFLKCPRMLMFQNVPEDLQKTINTLRHGSQEGSFRNIPHQKCYQWISWVGKKNRYPSVIKNFRFTREDQEVLKYLSREKDISETEVIREALRNLHRLYYYKEV